MEPQVLQTLIFGSMRSEAERGLPVDTLTCMQAFIKVVETGSLAEAGRRLEVSAPMMSQARGLHERDSDIERSCRAAAARRGVCSNSHGDGARRETPGRLRGLIRYRACVLDVHDRDVTKQNLR
jgi:hypothetical protein